MKKRPQHRLTKCLKPKKAILSLKNKISYQKTFIFFEKRSWMTKKPRAPLKIIRSFQKIKKSFENAMTCCKNTKLSLKTHFAFKEGYKFQWKNAHSTVLQNAWSQKKPILSLKNKISYQKNNDFLWKTIFDNKKT